MLSSELYGILGLVLLVAIINWIAVARNIHRLEYFSKPAVMVALLVWFGLATRLNHTGMWFILGMLFSLAGDVFLIVPRVPFVIGLSAFLVAHSCYIVGFVRSPVSINLAGGFLLIVLVIAGTQIYRRILTGLKAAGMDRLKIPVMVYAIIIGLMLFSALLTLTQSGWEAAPALLVSLGALLFYISDTCLACNKFVCPQQFNRTTIMITYHLGQLLIALGVALH